MTNYNDVNNAWPDPMPVPTPQEAISGVKRLIRKAFALAREDGAGRTFATYKGYMRDKKFKATSGRRTTWPHQGAWYVNPDERHNGRSGGWGEIVHSISHWAHRRFWPNEKPHAPRHVWIEAELTKYALATMASGQLRREPKAKPDMREVRAARVAKRITEWERKRKRAETALRKLRRQERYYARPIKRSVGDPGLPRSAHPGEPGGCGQGAA